MSRLEETALEALAGEVAEELPKQLAEAVGDSALFPEVVDLLEEFLAEALAEEEPLSEIDKALGEAFGEATPGMRVKGWLKKRAEEWVKDRAADRAEGLSDELSWVLSDELPDDGSCETLRGMLTEKERVKGMEGLTEKLAMKLAVEELTENGEPVALAEELAEKLPGPFVEEFAMDLHVMEAFKDPPP